jgi:hypothetical protein
MVLKNRLNSRDGQLSRNSSMPCWHALANSVQHRVTPIEWTALPIQRRCPIEALAWRLGFQCCGHPGPRSDPGTHDDEAIILDCGSSTAVSDASRTLPRCGASAFSSFMNLPGRPDRRGCCPVMINIGYSRISASTACSRRPEL